MAMTPKFELCRDFCTVLLPPKFHHLTFTRSEVIVLTNKQTHPQTNKQTDAAENIQRFSLRYDVGYKQTKSYSTHIQQWAISLQLTLSLPTPLRLHNLPYWSNPPFLISDIQALWRSILSARAPECQKLKMVGQTSMALNASNSNNLEQLALKRLIQMRINSRQLTCSICLKQRAQTIFGRNKFLQKTGTANINL